MGTLIYSPVMPSISGFVVPEMFTVSHIFHGWSVGDSQIILYLCKRFCHEEGQGNKNHIDRLWQMK